MGAIDSTTEHLRFKYRQTTGFDKFDDRRDFFLWVKIYLEEMKRLRLNPRRHLLKPTILTHRNLRKINRMMTPFPAKGQLLEDKSTKKPPKGTSKDHSSSLMILNEAANH